jgi:hypothetical protein
MKVRQLMEALAHCDPEAEVILAFQPHWPLETAIRGVTLRQECIDEDRQGGVPGPAPLLPDTAAPNDVLLVQGDFLRYGLPEAWDAAVTKRCLQ